jgi:hypothetical protein
VLVRTKGGYAAGRGQEGRSWLLIKHRDDWSSGELDIAEFAPLSVKSEGDFADILSQDNPDIWRSNRPAQGGETGAMFDKIVAQAMQMRESGTRGSGSGARGSETRASGSGPRDSGSGTRTRSAKRKAVKTTAAKTKATKTAKRR